MTVHNLLSYPVSFSLLHNCPAQSFSVGLCCYTPLFLFLYASMFVIPHFVRSAFSLEKQEREKKQLN